jgi:hypothetical protein
MFGMICLLKISNSSENIFIDSHLQYCQCGILSIRKPNKRFIYPPFWYHSRFCFKIFC